MSFRRAVVGFLLTRRFSPRKKLPVGGAAGVAAAALVGVGAWAVQYFPDDDESAAGKKEEDLSSCAAARKKEEDMSSCAAARKKEEDMKATFENWIKEYNKTYRDEEEKAMRFQVFKDTVESIESMPPASQKKFLPPNGFADLTSKELPCVDCCIDDDDFDDPDSEEYRQSKFLDENENGEAVVW